MDKLKIIKFIVVFLTFLLVFGTLMLLTLIYKKVHTSAPAHEIAFNLDQPQGTAIKSVQTTPDEVYLVLSGGGLSDRLVIYNRNSTAVVTTLSVN